MTYFEKEIEAINQTADPISRYERFNSLLYTYIDGQHSDVVIKLLKQCIDECELSKNYNHQAVFYYSLSYIYLSKGEKALFKDCRDKAFDRQKYIELPSTRAMFLTYESIIAWFEGRRNDGFDLIFKAINQVEHSNYHEVTGWCYFTLATYQFDSNQLTEAEENYQKSLDNFKLCNSRYGYARSNNGIASIKIKEEKLIEAAEILTEIRDIYVQFDKLSGLSRALTDLGVIEYKLGHYPEALVLYEHAYEMRVRTSNLQGQITSLLEMGQLLIAMKNYAEAEQKLLEAARLTGENKFKAKAFRAHELLAQLYKEQGKFEQANEHLEKYFDYKTQVLADESTGRIKLLQTQLLAEEASKRAELEMKNNQELREAYSIIESKNSEILQSIDYAKRIQKTILPALSKIKHLVKDYFILYQPKDIVAGDFYWMHSSGNKLLFAVCDCTGHGVPGAFVSLVCSQALNRAVIEFNIWQPAQILNKVNELVIESFSGNEQEQVNDGMDASLLLLDFDAQTCSWAGANNPLLLLESEQGAMTLKEFKGNKQPIGRFDFAQPFTQQEFAMKPGSQFYLFSDGYADQFGGESFATGGKKFSKKQFRALLLELAALPMHEQKSKLEKALDHWKGKLDQIDDVLVAGISI